MIVKTKKQTRNYQRHIKQIKKRRKKLKIEIELINREYKFKNIYDFIMTKQTEKNVDKNGKIQFNDMQKKPFQLIEKRTVFEKRIYKDNVLKKS